MHTWEQSSFARYSVKNSGSAVANDGKLLHASIVGDEHTHNQRHHAVHETHDTLPQCNGDTARHA
jgi:hypothetical protein